MVDGAPHMFHHILCILAISGPQSGILHNSDIQSEIVSDVTGNSKYQRIAHLSANVCVTFIVYKTLVHTNMNVLGQ